VLYLYHDLRYWDLFLTRKSWAIVAFSIWATCCLNFSAAPHQTLSLSMTPSHGCDTVQTLWQTDRRLPELWLFLIFKSEE
jgi:hypothetical protein